MSGRYTALVKAYEEYRKALREYWEAELETDYLCRAQVATEVYIYEQRGGEIQDISAQTADDQDKIPKNPGIQS